MKASVVSTWILLLATTAYIQKVNGASDPLIRAVRNNNVDLVKSLLDSGADTKATDIVDGYNALMIALRYKKSDKIVKLLIPKSDVKATSNSGGTALMLALEFGNDKMAKLLIPKSDVKATDNYGYSALMWAARKKNVKMAKLLIPNSDVKATDRNGWSALIIAAIMSTKYQDNELVKLLLPQSDVTATDNYGSTALDYAKHKGHNQIVSLLQQYN